MRFLVNYIHLVSLINKISNSVKYWKLGFVNVALVGFFPVPESDGILGFLNVSLGCTCKFFPFN